MSLKFYFTATLLFLWPTISTIAQNDSNIPCQSAGLKMDHLSVDFGRVPQWQQVEHLFYLSNTSDTSATIKGVSTSCSCTAAKIPDKTIAPGETQEVRLTFLAKSSFGPNTTHATIQFTDPNICPIRLQLEANVFSVGPHFSPNRVYFNQIQFQTPATETIRVVNQGEPDRQWEILSIVPSSPHLQADYLENLGEINVSLAKNAPPGEIKESLTVTIGQDNELPYEVTLPVTGKVLGPITAIPSQIFISNIKPGETITKKLSLIFSPNISPSEILTDNLPPSVTTLKEMSRTDNKTLYLLTLQAPSKPGLHTSQLILQTNHPDHPNVTIPIRFFIQ